MRTTQLIEMANQDGKVPDKGKDEDHLQQQVQDVTISPSSSSEPETIMASWSWKGDLWKNIQRDPNQTAVDLVQHAFSDSLNNEATALFLRIVAQRILVEVQQQVTSSSCSTESMSTATTTAADNDDPVDNKNNNISSLDPSTASSSKNYQQQDSSTSCLGLNTDTFVHSPSSSSSSSDWMTRPFSSVLSSCETKNEIAATYNNNNNQRNDTSYQPMTVAEGLALPVEQLCPNTGTVLQKFASGWQAQHHISKSTQAHFFWYAVQGRNKV